MQFNDNTSILEMIWITACVLVGAWTIGRYMAKGLVYLLEKLIK